LGAKYVIQSLPLQQPEAPLVQNLVGNDTDESFDEKFGTRVGALRARDRGVVTDIGKDHIQVRYADGTKENHELYQNFPFNRKTFLHNTPVVNVGDQIKPNQLLAKSNYTDDKGVVAMGNNLRVAYLPYQGLNYEDAIVISESASKMMSSEHMYQHEIEGDPNIITGRNQYVSIFPSQFDKKQLSAIDAKGVAKVGSVVKYGDPLILSLNKAKPTAVHRGHKAMFSDGAITWDHESDGIVTDVDKTREGGYNVTVKAYMPAREGDKLAGRYGDKGVVSKIIPDDQMVQDRKSVG
jgi:DNA-directed RNA polymerase subunit beta